MPVYRRQAVLLLNHYYLSVNILELLPITKLEKCGYYFLLSLSLIPAEKK
jgi:hypothetical protein